jgi:hypothetical protein
MRLYLAMCYDDVYASRRGGGGGGMTVKKLSIRGGLGGEIPVDDDFYQRIFGSTYALHCTPAPFKSPLQNCNTCQVVHISPLRMRLTMPLSPFVFGVTGLDGKLLLPSACAKRHVAITFLDWP